MNIVDCHVADIKQGDTIVHEGRVRTVCLKDLGRTALLGRTVFGDSYKAGHKPVQKVVIERALPTREQLEYAL